MDKYSRSVGEDVIFSQGKSLCTAFLEMHIEDRKSAARDLFQLLAAETGGPEVDRKPLENADTHSRRSA